MRKRLLVAMIAAVLVGANVGIADAMSEAPLASCEGGNSCRDAGDSPNSWCADHYEGCNLCQFNIWGPHCATTEHQ